MRWVVPGKKTLSASTTRACPGRRSRPRGWSAPASTTAAAPSPKIAVETTLVADLSQRWKVRLANSTARTTATRSGWATR